MLTVETFIGPSKIHRLGLFAAQPIAQCTMIAYKDTRLDNLIFKDYYAAANSITKNVIDHYAFRFYEFNYYLLYHDNARFINHSAKNNICYADSIDVPATSRAQPHRFMDALVALRDIPSGEELTLDYSIYCPYQYSVINDFVERRDANLWPPKVKIGDKLNERKTDKA
jgi:SET domain-containing protein